MDLIYKNILFSKHILVRDQRAEEKCVPEVLFSLAKIFNIRITKGGELAHRDMIKTVENMMIGTKVPEPFYGGFPRSVLKHSKESVQGDWFGQGFCDRKRGRGSQYSPQHYR